MAQHGFVSSAASGRSTEGWCCRPSRMQYVDGRTRNKFMVCCLECCYNVNDSAGGNVHSFECNAEDANRQYAAEVDRQGRRSIGGSSNSSSAPQLLPTRAPSLASAPASAASGTHGGGCASSATHERRNGASDHGCSVFAPLVASSGSRRSIGGSSNSSSVPQLFPTRAPSLASASASAASGTHGGGCASSATHGRRNGASGNGCSVVAPLVASSGSRRSIGGSSNSSSVPQLSPAHVPAMASAPASSASVTRDGGVASSATHVLRNGACDHGCSVGAPLVSSGNGGGHGRSISAPHATRGNPTPSPTIPTPSPTPVLVRQIRPMYGVHNEDGSRPTCHEDGTTLTYWEMLFSSTQ